MRTNLTKECPEIKNARAVYLSILRETTDNYLISQARSKISGGSNFLVASEIILSCTSSIGSKIHVVYSTWSLRHTHTKTRHRWLCQKPQNVPLLCGLGDKKLQWSTLSTLQSMAGCVCHSSLSRRAQIFLLLLPISAPFWSLHGKHMLWYFRLLRSHSNGTD